MEMRIFEWERRAERAKREANEPLVEDEDMAADQAKSFILLSAF
jgi:hypothetical protein